jgi:S1-C subfamily serine protease
LLVAIAYFSLLGADVFGFDSLRNTPVVQAIKRAEPAVVNIQGNKTITNASSSGGPSKQEVNGMGTGVIIDRRGYIITNYHVVDEVNRIEVTLADGTTSIAKLLKHDNETDLALIKIPTSRDLPVIENVDLFNKVDDIRFLELLDQEGLFGDGMGGANQ